MIYLYLSFILIHFFVLILTLTKYRKNIILGKLALALSVPFLSYLVYFCNSFGFLNIDTLYLHQILLIFSGTNTAFIYIFITKEDSEDFSLEPFYLLNILSLSAFILTAVTGWLDKETTSVIVYINFILPVLFVALRAYKLNARKLSGIILISIFLFSLIEIVWVRSIFDITFTLCASSLIFFIIPYLNHSKLLSKNKIDLLFFIFNSCKSGILILDANSKVSYANFASKRILDIKYLDLYGIHIQDILREFKLPKTYRQNKVKTSYHLFNNELIHFSAKTSPLQRKGELIGHIIIFEKI